MVVGQSYRLGDYLDGIENGYVMAIASPNGIVTISQSDGFLVTGLAAGECVIEITKGDERIELSVTVTG